MLTEFSCPVCGAHAWKALQEVEIQSSEPLPEGAAGEYLRLRRRILFEVWFPGALSVRLRPQVCQDCGFVLYAPRPTDQDVDAKYRFMQAIAAQNSGTGASVLTQAGKDMDRRRAQRIYAAVRRHLRPGPLAVLDFGGEDGKLLGPFLESGCNCDLIDYSRSVRPGVRKIGDTLDDAPADLRYDVIICSHVLEHVGEPGTLVGRLAERLVEGGVIYGEVPLEMWGGMAALRWDPVTHINYYNVGSFSRLFESRGLNVLESREAGGSYGRERFEVVIVVARKGGPPGRSRRDGVRRTLRRHQPSVLDVVRRSWRVRQWPPYRELAGSVRRLLPAPLRRSIKSLRRPATNKGEEGHGRD